MTHLRDAASALVDGELDGAARDRALAHLAVCPRCMADVDTARRMKTRLAGTAAATADLAVAQGLLDSLARVPERPIVAGNAPGSRAPARRYLAVAGVAASVLVGVGGGAATFTSGASGTSPAPEIDTTVSTTPVDSTLVSTTPLFSVRPHPRPALSVVYRRP